jgi:branched-chain amino acid transport system substrate-binding protein
MRVRAIAASVALLVLVTLVPRATPGPAVPVRIGIITSLTGRFATFGKMQMAGYTVALKEINGKGGVQGRALDLLIEDDASDVPAALSAAERLLAKGVPLILGTYSSGISKPLAGYMDRQQVPLLVSGSSDDSITKPGSPYVFRAKSVATTYARTLFDLFDTLGGIQSLAILAGTGAFEQSVADGAEAYTRIKKIKLVAREAYDRGLTDFRPLLNKFRTLEANGIFMVSYEEDAVAIMRQAKEVNLNPKIFAGAAAGFAIESFIKGAGDAAEWVFTSTSWTRDVKYKGTPELYQNLKAALGGEEPSYHAAEAYMALIVGADALNRAKSFEKTAIMAALKATDLLTPVGPVQFLDSAGFRNQNPIPMVVQQVQGGQFVTVFPAAIALGRPKYPTPPWNQR